MNTRIAAIVSLIALVALAGTLGADWPGFLGADRAGVSPDKTTLARNWPKEGPKELWSRKMFSGFGGAAIVDGRVYLMDRMPQKKDIVLCLDLETGEKKWEYSYNAPGKLRWKGSRATPSVDDEHIYTVGPFGQVHALSHETHKPVWSLDLAKDFDGKVPMWAYASSPLLLGEWVILAPQTPTVGLVAVKRDSGEVAWKSPSLGEAGHSSPRLMTLDGRKQIVMLARKQLAGLDPNTGKVLWRFRNFKSLRPIPGPVPIGKRELFFTSGYGMGGIVLRVTRDEGGNWACSETARNERISSHIATPIVHKGYVYVPSNSRNVDLGLVCLDKDAKIVWNTGRDPSFGFGNQIMADGLLVLVDAQKRDLVLVDPNPKEYRELARADIIKGRHPWAPLAIDKGRLIVRDTEKLLCLDLAAKKETD
jgi:outer membrane protein assembly factor BamB